MTDTNNSNPVLIIGAGIAGLWTALSMAPRPVTVITASRLGAGSSSWAQGGLAAAIGSGDSAAAHAEDTLSAGAGLCDAEAVRVLTEGGPAAVEALASAGVPFDRSASGDFTLGREAAHGTDRIVHVGGDAAGAAIMKTLTALAREADHIELIEGHVVERVLTKDRGVCGVMVWDRSGQRARNIAATHVILATGGLGGLFAVTTNPLSAQGHGIALAAEVGATLRDVEFVQFHPTGLDVGRDPAPLATEAIRGEGGQLVDAQGSRFMTRLHPSAELAPRDIVARGVAQAIAETGGAFLDVRNSIGAAFVERFPTVASAAQEAGIDPVAELIPVAPAAHYHMGGVRTDTWGRTDIDGLYAVGECASTGVHGANRLASNSLLEAIVFGTRIGGALQQDTLRDPAPMPERDEVLIHAPATELKPLRDLLSKELGMVRDAQGLEDTLQFIDDRPARSVGDRLAQRAARLLVRAALARQESRGAHQRRDHRDTERPARHSLIKACKTDMDWQEVSS
ncbi:MAG: L-aspartate oxidase [Parvularculaceae bacterium]|nr:L-aspartate oxidase [Parvularculaceae bacterium]